MKRFVAIALLCVALTGQTQRTDMTDAEITEFIHGNRTMTELQKKANEAVAAVQSYSTVMQKRFEEMKKAHGAEGCQVGPGPEVDGLSGCKEMMAVPVLLGLLECCDS